MVSHLHRLRHATHVLYWLLQFLYSNDDTIAQEGNTDLVTSGPQHAVYAISVAAELAGTAVQNLRVYERVGLLTPSRTSGGTRRYSDDDVARLRRIVALLDDGLNLAGVARVLALEEENADLRAAARRSLD